MTSKIHVEISTSLFSNIKFYIVNIIFLWRGFNVSWNENIAILEHDPFPALSYLYVETFSSERIILVSRNLFDLKSLSPSSGKLS